MTAASSASLSVDGRVATITLARPEAGNAIDAALAEALLAAFAHVNGDPAVRCIVFAALGARFGVGGDLSSFDGRAPDEAADAAQTLLRPLHALLRAIRGCPQPVLAAVRGAAAGGSLSLALACDVGVWAEGARLVPAYAAIGASPDCGLTWTLARALGPQRALEWLLHGQALAAPDARRLGLLRHVVPDDELDAHATRLARQLATLPPAAVAATKRLVHRAVDASWGEQLDAEADAFVDCVRTPEFAARVGARRRPASVA